MKIPCPGTEQYEAWRRGRAAKPNKIMPRTYNYDLILDIWATGRHSLATAAKVYTQVTGVSITATHVFYVVKSNRARGDQRALVQGPGQFTRLRKGERLLEAGK